MLLALLAFIAGCGGTYYAFFTVALVAASGVAKAVVRRRWQAVAPAVMVIGSIALATAVQLAPSLVYWQAEGRNPHVAARLPQEAEYYAFKPIQLFLPQPRHRLDTARRIAVGYAATSPGVNENNTAALGIVGAVGLALTVAHGLRRMLVRRPDDPAIDSLAWQAFVAMALGTIGGLGSMLAYLGFTTIRGYNRISVFLGFIALAVLLLMLQRRLSQIADARWRAYAGTGAVVAVAAVGLLDQTPAALRIDSASFTSDREFFGRLERGIPAGTAVYQLPYHPFPEAGADNALEDYGLARGYLNTRTLKWSYGAMKGRGGDEWLQLLAKRDVADQLELAARSGFGAVTVDRRGYVDGGAALEADLSRRLGTPVALSTDRMLAAYRLNPTGTSPVARDELLPPIDTPIGLDRGGRSALVAELNGFGASEPAGRWTEGPVARIELTRPLPRRFILRVETVTAMPPSVDVALPVRIGGVERAIRVGAGPTVAEVPFRIADAARTIEIAIAHPVSPRDLRINADPRELGILVKSIAIIPEPGN
jgi:phosphoglycerol transferase